MRSRPGMDTTTTATGCALSSPEDPVVGVREWETVGDEVTGEETEAVTGLVMVVVVGVTVTAAEEVEKGAEEEVVVVGAVETTDRMRSAASTV